MAGVKRPGSPERLLEDAGEPERITQPRHIVDIHTPGVLTMAKKASKTGVYKIGDATFLFNEGDLLPDGEEATFVEDNPNPVSQEAEEQAQAAAQEKAQADARAKGPAPENRAR